METKPMTVGKRITYLKQEIEKCKVNLKEVKRLGGHSCYAVGYEDGMIQALVCEIDYLEGWWDGK